MTDLISTFQLFFHIFALVYITSFQANELNAFKFGRKDARYVKVIGMDFVKEFALIESMLVKNTNSEDPEINMSIVEDSYKVESARATPLAEAEELFLSLRQLGSGELCNMYGFNIMVQNHYAIDASADIKELVTTPSKRIEKVFVAYLKQHNAACRKKYPKMLEEIVESMDKRKLELVVAVADRYIDAIAINFINRFGEQFSTEAEETFLVAKRKYIPQAGYLHDMLQTLAKSDSEARCLDPETSHDQVSVNNRHVENMFKKYLLKPCQYFVSKVGVDIYFPARYWIDLHQVDDNQLYWYLNWARFKFCVYLEAGSGDILKKLQEYSMDGRDISI